MLGFTKKRFFITLVLSVTIWAITAIYQGYSTFANYLGTFSSGCQVTGYPVDVCLLQGRYISPVVIIIVNIVFWFWVVHVIWGFARRSKS